MTTPTDEAASAAIDARIAELGDWRGETLARVRAVLRAADPEVVEELKWRGTPVWSRAGIICTGETYQRVVKLTFPKGAALADPSGLFNSSLEGNVRRAIDFHAEDRVDARALTALVRAAIALNLSRSTGKARAGAKKTPARTPRKTPARTPRTSGRTPSKVGRRPSR